MININFNTKPDYSYLNPPKFFKIHKIFNTVLVPKNQMTDNIYPSDTISILKNNKLIKQKVGLDCGTVTLYDTEYYYFYIIPGFIDDTIIKNYEIFIGNQQLKLKTYLDPTTSAKIINGIVILPNNYNYAFFHTNYSIILTDNKNILTNITKHESKYNYYMANTNNTILHILDSKNIDSIYAINNCLTDIYIRPLFNYGYPLGKLIIDSDGVSNSRIKVGQNIFSFNGHITIDNLPSGKYNISVLDSKNEPITIGNLNNNTYEKNNFDVDIDKIYYKDNGPSSIPSMTILGKSKQDMSNLTVNIKPNSTKFELYGPNNFYRKYNTGYQQLLNIYPGNYNIKYNNTNKNILVIKNDNNYYSNINN
jgi:hypothetical protein